METNTIHQLELNTRLFNNVLSEIKEGDSNVRFSDSTNSLKWIAGHCVDILHNVGLMLGVVTENLYGNDFGYGSTFDANKDYESLENLINSWNTLVPRLTGKLKVISDDELDRSLPFQIPFSDQTIKGFLAFQMHHLGYEIGQMGIYRKFIGLPAMSY